MGRVVLGGSIQQRCCITIACVVLLCCSQTDTAPSSEFNKQRGGRLLTDRHTAVAAVRMQHAANIYTGTGSWAAPAELGGACTWVQSSGHAWLHSRGLKGNASVSAGGGGVHGGGVGAGGNDGAGTAVKWPIVNSGNCSLAMYVRTPVAKLFFILNKEN